MVACRACRSCRSAGFNGAMAVRPWMAINARAYRIANMLQWGHGREAMDG